MAQPRGLRKNPPNPSMPPRGIPNFDLNPPGNNLVQAIQVTTDVSGNATWFYATGYNSTPTIATAVVQTGTEPLIVTLLSVAPLSVTIQVYQGRKLPATITAFSDLQSYDVFAGSGISGIVVHLTATGS